MTFNGIIHLNHTQMQVKKLKSLDRRATELTKDTNIKSTLDLLKQHACQIVRKCLDGESCDNMNGYFEILAHERCTRNNGLLTRIPKIRLNGMKHSFFYAGTVLYNKLPLEIRESNPQDFIRKIKNFKF